MRLTLANLCAGYAQPCVLDVKLGFRTDYAWAGAEYNAKNRCMKGRMRRAAAQALLNLSRPQEEGRREHAEQPRVQGEWHAGRWRWGAAAT